MKQRYQNKVALGSVLLAAGMLGMTSAIKMAVMSDIHILPMYRAEINNTCYCSEACPGQNKAIPKDLQSGAYAPLGRLYCDPPQILTESMIKKLKLEQPDLDVLIVTGDIVGHTYSQDLDQTYNQTKYDTLLAVHKNFSVLFAREFPNTILLPTFGNNDFEFHYQAPNATDREVFYRSIYNNWFVDNAFNARALDTELIRTTFYTGGYYRVNLNQNVSVLALNSLVWSVKNRDIKDDAGQQEAMLNWLEEQLATAESGRKFILTNHIYFGVQTKDGASKALWYQNYTLAYARILERFHDKVLIELSGHEHLGDVRYHSGSLFALDGLFERVADPELKFTGPALYHNIVINPGVTSFDGQNPGFTLLQLDLTTQTAYNLRQHFLQIEQTYGWQEPFPELAAWPWLSLDYAAMLGLTQLTPEGIQALEGTLKGDAELAKRYLVRKAGFNESDPVEYGKSLEVYREFGLVSKTAGPDELLPYFCQMSSSLLPDELKRCKDTPAAPHAQRAFLSAQ